MAAAIYDGSKSRSPHLAIHWFFTSPMQPNRPWHFIGGFDASSYNLDMNKIAYFLLGLAILGSCKKHKRDETKTIDSMTCQAHVDEFQSWVTTLIKEGNVEAEFSAADLDLVVTEAELKKSVDQGISLTLSPSIVMVEGSVISKGIDEKLDLFLHNLKADLDKRSMRETSLSIFADSKLLWKDLVEAINISIAEGFTEIHFVFLGPAPIRSLSAPPKSSMHDEILRLVDTMTATSPSGRTSNVQTIKQSNNSSILQRASSSCPQLLALHDKEIPTAPPNQRLELLTSGVVSALLACDCAVDTAILKEIYWHLHSFPTPTRIKYSSHRFNLKTSKKEVVFKAPAEATWQEVHTTFLGLTSAGESPSLVVEVE